MNEYWAAEAAFAAVSTPARYDAYAELRRGETLYFISSLNAERLRPAEALSAALTARAIGEALLKRRPDSARVHALVGRARHGVAGALLNLRHAEESDVEFAAAADAEREACRLAPWEADYPRFLANHLIGRGRALFALGRQDDALLLFDECCRTQPNHPYYHWATGWDLWNRIGRLPYRDGAHKGRFLEAVVWRFRRAIELKYAEYLQAMTPTGDSSTRGRRSLQLTDGRRVVETLAVERPPKEPKSARPTLGEKPDRPLIRGR